MRKGWIIAAGTAALVTLIAVIGILASRGPASEVVTATAPVAAPVPALSIPPAPAAHPGAIEEPATITREELEERLHELVGCYVSGDAESYNRLFAGLSEMYEERLVGPLVEILQEESAEDIGVHAANLLGVVARPADAPAVAALIGAGVVDPVAEILLGVMIRQGGPEAVPAAGTIVVDAARGESLRRAAVQYLGVAATDEAVEVLGRALGEEDFAVLHAEVAGALAHTNRPAAARALLRVWTDRFEPTVESAQEQRYLLRALGSMNVDVAGGMVREFVLGEPDPSRKNMVLSIAPLLGEEFTLGLVRELLGRAGEHYRVREQAIEVVGRLHTKDAQAYLIEILTGATEQTDFFAAANELTAQPELAVEFADLAQAYRAAGEALPQAVLVVLLARDAATVKADGALYDEVWGKVQSWLHSDQPVLVMYAATAFSLLSAVADRPLESIAQLLDALTPEQASSVPAILGRLAQLDPREARPLYDRFLRDGEAYGAHFRAQAVQGLLALRDFDAAWDAIRREPDGGVRVALSGMAVAQQGPEGLTELRATADREQDPETRQVLDQQVETWTNVYDGQRQAEGGSNGG